MSATLHHIDKALANKVVAGDAAAFDEFFKCYFPKLFRFVMARVSGDSLVAEEIVQRTLCQVVETLSKYRGEASLYTWLCQISRNELSAHYRRNRLEAAHNLPLEDNPAVLAALESLSAGENRPEDARRSQEVARFVQLTLDNLPVRYATALEMKYVLGASVEEVGEQLGVGVKAAESVLSRARAAFKDGFQTLWGANLTELLG